MSGGSWDYLCYKIDEAADRLYNSTDPIRKQFSEHLYLVAKALHDIEWVDSGDISPGDEHESIRKVISREDAKNVYEKLKNLLEESE